MTTKIRRTTDAKKRLRYKRKKRGRAKMSGTAERPRISIFRSNKYLYAQLIDDVKGNTLVSASTLEEDMKKSIKGLTMDGAKQLGGVVAKRAIAKNIKKVVFDRSGYLFHGKLKAFAEAAREAGLQF